MLETLDALPGWQSSKVWTYCVADVKTDVAGRKFHQVPDDGRFLVKKMGT